MAISPIIYKELIYKDCHKFHEFSQGTLKLTSAATKVDLYRFFEYYILTKQFKHKLHVQKSYAYNLLIKKLSKLLVKRPSGS